MLGLLVHLLALALYAAFAPVAALVCILLLEGPRPLTRAGAYALGYLAALLGVAAAGAYLLGLLGSWAGPALAALLSPLLADVRDPSAGRLALDVALGVALLFAAAWRWLRRSPPAGSAALPAWLNRVERVGPLEGFGLGALLMITNWDNALAFLAAVNTIGGAGFGPGGELLALALLVAISAAPALLPVAVTLVAPARSAGALAALRVWIGRISQTAVTALLAVLGGWLVARGLFGLLGLPG